MTAKTAKTAMKANVIGLGIWGRGMTSYADLQRVLELGGLPADAEFLAPKPEAIPARERRRAGLMINLAVSVAHQACEHAGVDKASIPSVFVSSMGDTDITDYMCRKLTQPEKLLSPTKFHNSVHNAPSGYWTISAENRAPSTFVGGDQYSFGAGLLEAVSQVQASNTPVLLVAYDIANQAPFADVTPIGESFAAALVLAPPDAPGVGSELSVSVQLQPLSIAQLQAQGRAYSKVSAPGLDELAAQNPMAGGLALLEQLVNLQQTQTKSAELVLPAASQLALVLDLQAVQRNASNPQTAQVN